ncbi:response regulator [Reyranella sp.]|uniref:response regulator n=1 Tax=Reyranella sp. TaxID=1929291 RepID=UPI003D126CA6
MLSKLPVICVVDDDAAVRNALKFALEVEGLNVRLFDGAVSLLSDPAILPCGCIVIDYRMPVIDGLELIGVLRRRGIEAPVILITGRANKELRAQAQKLGVHCLLEKPLSDDALLDSIRSALAKAG